MDKIIGGITTDGPVIAGGGVQAGGESHFRGNVTIDGMLLATSLRVPCVGLYSDSGALRGAVPYPIAGMWAYVGGGFPARIWRAENGRWVDSGVDGGVETPLYVDTLESGMEDMRDRVGALESKSEGIALAVENALAESSTTLDATRERLTLLIEAESSSRQNDITAIERGISDLEVMIERSAASVTASGQSAIESAIADLSELLFRERDAASAESESLRREMDNLTQRLKDSESATTAKLESVAASQSRTDDRIDREIARLEGQLENLVLWIDTMQPSVAQTVALTASPVSEELAWQIDKASKDINALRDELQHERETRSVSDNKLLRWLRHEVWVRRCQYWRLLKVIAECYRAISDANEAADRANSAADRVEEGIDAAKQALETALEAKELCESAAEDARKAGEDALKTANDAAAAAMDRVDKWVEQSDARVDEAIEKMKEQNDASMRDVAEAADRANAAADRAEAAAERAERATDALGIPEEMTVTTPGVITLGNRTEKRIEATLMPGETHNVLCLVDEGDSVKVLPDGKVIAQRAGVTKVNVIPPQNVGIYQTVEVVVKNPDIRLTGGRSIRLANGKVRLT
ncbi:hypothetical protein [Paramuribaculum intestinale]|uniref:hypothetical protein n=1 Tax=Paramuribaculum intestinale TaxID=2094151 RepID=UPI0025AA0E2C|nr:hypothetical protein [Paramuribaculum intestinale]